MRHRQPKKLVEAFHPNLAERKRRKKPKSLKTYKEKTPAHKAASHGGGARRKDVPMIEAQQGSTSTTVIPALLHILDEPGCAVEKPQRRITVLLDHPVVKQLGWFSWSLAIVALAATRPVTAIPISILVLAGLLVGFINATRWLFSRKR